MKSLLTEVENHIIFLNQKEALENNSNAVNLLNLAMEDIVFSFVKIKDEELKLADDLKNVLRHTRESLLHNFDKQDIEFITLKEELQRLFEKGNITDVSQELIQNNIVKIKELYARSEALNLKNKLLKQKYGSDEKFARLHKRIKEQHISDDDIAIQDFLLEVKNKTDEEILNHSAILNNEANFTSKVLKYVAEGLKSWLNIDFSAKKKIGNDITNEYIREHNGEVA
jgi:type I restriction enzyme R subunit